MNSTVKKFLKRLAKVGVGFVAFAGTLVGGYMLTPNRTRLLSVKVEEPEQSAFEKFVSKLQKDVGLEEDEEQTVAKYLSATFDEFKISYSVENSSKVNTVAIDGGLDLRISDLSLAGVEFNLYANVDYNGRELPLSVGHFNNDLYFSIKDLKLKCSNISKLSILKEYYPIFAQYGGLDFGMMYDALDDFLVETIDKAVDGMLSSSSGSGLDLSGFSTEEKKEGNMWKFTLNVSENIVIKIYSDENFSLKRVDLGTISVGGVNISGAINFDLKPYDEFVSPAKDDSYVEIFNYGGLIQKLATLLKEDDNHQKLGLEFSADLNSVSTNNTTDVALIEGSINVDFDNLLDLSQYACELPEGPQPNNMRREPTASNGLYDTIKKVGFNLQLDLIGQNDVEYANLDVAFAEGQGYIRFNEQEDQNGDKSSVMKLNIDTETMNWLMSELPGLISNLSGEKQNDTLETLSSFLTDDLADAIKDGDYSFIIDMIKTLSNDEDSINLGIDLSKLGIGDNASVDLAINTEAGEKTLDLDVHNLAFGDFTLDLDVDSAEFKEAELGTLSEYQSVKFLPDVIDQVAELVETPKTGFEVTGSVLDKDGLGIKLNGEGQFDNTEDVKAGYGSLSIEQYKYHSNKVWATHNIHVDVTNLEENVIKTQNPDETVTRNNQNEALFVYGDPNGDNVKGKMHLQSFLDIVEIGKTFISESKDDPKYTKFLAPITKLLGVSALGDIIAEKNYLKLASNELLKELSIFDNGSGIKIVVGGSLIGLGGDLTIKVNFEGDNDSESQRIKSLEVIDLKLGEGDSVKTVNLKLSLQAYDSNMVNHINRNDDYMNLDGIVTLLDLGINTTKLNYYHLSADVNVDTILGINVALKGINFYIYVDGVHVKLYGKIDKVPLIVVASEDYTLLHTDRSMSAEMTFETYDDSEKPEGDDVGGIFNIKRTVKTPKTRLVWEGWVPSTQDYDEYSTYQYRCDSKNFLDNILDYLLVGMIGIKSNLVSQLGGTSLTSSEEKEAGDFTKSFTSTGFNHSKSGTGMDTVNRFNIGLNLDVLTGISALKEVEVTLTSKRMSKQGVEGGIDVLNKVSATLRVHFAVDINVALTASVVDAMFDADSALAAWNSNANSAFNAVANANIGSGHYNAPNNPYTTTYEIVH